MKKKYEITSPEMVVGYSPVFRRPLFYPENDFSKDIALIMRRKSFSKSDIEALRKIGFSILIRARAIELPGDIDIN